MVSRYVNSDIFVSQTMILIPTVQNKALDNVKSATASKATSAAPSRASSVLSSNSNAGGSKSKKGGKKK